MLVTAHIAAAYVLVQLIARVKQAELETGGVLTVAGVPLIALPGTSLVGGVPWTRFVDLVLWAGALFPDVLDKFVLNHATER